MAGISKSLATLARRQGFSFVRDLAGLGGLGAIAYGCWLISHPAGFIVGGLLLTGSCVASAFIEAR